MAKSKVGSVLLLIASILTLVFSIIFIISTLGFQMSASEKDVVGYVIILVILIFLIIVVGLKVWAYRLMKIAKTTKKGGIVALVVGILSGDILAIIGGIFGIVDAEK